MCFSLFLCGFPACRPTLRYLAAVGLLMASVTARAQSQEALPVPKPLRVGSNQPVRIRGYLTPVTELSSLSGRPAVLVGGNLAVLLNRQVSVGAYALTTATPLRGLTSANPNALQFTQAGGLLGYSFRPRRALHLAVGTHIGAGWLVRPNNAAEIVATTWVVAPQAQVELNLKRWLRASIGAGYRQVNGGGAVAQENRLSNPTLSLGLSLGWFD